MAEIVTAYFDSDKDAQDALDWLRSQKAPESAIWVIARNDRFATTTDDGEETRAKAGDAGKGALTGLGVGAGVGALFGLAAAAIPGVGPFIAAGALASTLGATGGAAAAGAIVGGTSGGLAGALSGWGLSPAEADYAARQVEEGGTLVGVDLAEAPISRLTAAEGFRRYRGRLSDESVAAGTGVR